MRKLLLLICIGVGTTGLCLALVERYTAPALIINCVVWVSLIVYSNTRAWE